MNHWHTADHLASDRRSDFERDAAGGHRMRAAGAANSTRSDSRPSSNWAPIEAASRYVARLRSASSSVRRSITATR
jgi:hypothetical protein